MGEAKRRKELGLPPREKPVELKLPVLDKENIQKKVINLIWKNLDKKSGPTQKDFMKNLYLSFLSH